MAATRTTPGRTEATPPRRDRPASGGAGAEFRRLADGVAAEPRWSAVARKWSHRTLRESGAR